MRLKTVGALVVASLLLGACGGPHEAKKAASQPTAPKATKSAPTTPKPSPKPSKVYPKATKTVYLTFDDGPWPETPKVLAALQKAGVKATFFEIGKQEATYGSYAKELVGAGMSLGVHSWSHKDYTLYSNSWIVKDLNRTQEAIEDTTGFKADCVRPPYGATNARVHSAIRADGFKQVMWDVDSEDWRRPGVKTIVANVMREVKDNSIILMHDGGGDRSQTVAAIPTIVDNLKMKGYEFKLICS